MVLFLDAVEKWFEKLDVNY